jgi:hypothetical protein
MMISLQIRWWQQQQQQQQQFQMSVALEYE